MVLAVETAWVSNESYSTKPPLLWHKRLSFLRHENKHPGVYSTFLNRQQQSPHVSDEFHRTFLQPQTSLNSAFSHLGQKLIFWLSVLLGGKGGKVGQNFVGPPGKQPALGFRMEWGVTVRERETIPTPPHHSVFLLYRRPHNLNAWNRLRGPYDDWQTLIEFWFENKKAPTRDSLIDLVTVLEAILTIRQPREKLQHWIFSPKN